jgi:hypothetical protein
MDLQEARVIEQPFHGVQCLLYKASQGPRTGLLRAPPTTHRRRPPMPGLSDDPRETQLSAASSSLDGDAADDTRAKSRIQPGRPNADVHGKTECGIERACSPDTFLFLR